MPQPIKIIIGFFIVIVLAFLFFFFGKDTKNLSSVIPPSSQVAAISGAGSGLVGYWNFNEGSGTTAADTSGSGNNGALTGGTTWVAGKIGGALLFNGTNSYMSTGMNVP